MSIGQEFDDGTVVIQAKRRWTELFMLLIAWAIGFGGWVLTELNINHVLPDTWTTVGGVWRAWWFGYSWPTACQPLKP